MHAVLTPPVAAAAAPGVLPLTQAHARLLVRSSVTLQDAVVAVLLADSSMAGASLLGATNALHTHFPADPDQDYLQQEGAVLRGLGLAKQEVGGGGAAGGGSWGVPGGGWQGGGSSAAGGGGGSCGWNSGTGQPQRTGHTRAGPAAAGMQDDRLARSSHADQSAGLPPTGQRPPPAAPATAHQQPPPGQLGHVGPCAYPFTPARPPVQQTSSSQRYSSQPVVPMPPGSATAVGGKGLVGGPPPAGSSWGRSSSSGSQGGAGAQQQVPEASGCTQFLDLFAGV